MATTALERGVMYGWYYIDWAADEYFYPDEIPEDFHWVFEKEMSKLMPEGVIWIPGCSEVWTGNGEGGDVEVSDEEWEAFDWDEAVEKAFNVTVAQL